MPVQVVKRWNFLENRSPLTEEEQLNLANMDNEDFYAGSNHTAELYSDVSDDEFTDCNSEFLQEVNQLEREYFESLHIENVESNVNFADSPVFFASKGIDRL